MIITQTPFRMSFLVAEQIWKAFLEKMVALFCLPHLISIVM